MALNMKECSECSRASDNKYFNCPPKMADGRHFTDYRPRCQTNAIIPNNQPLNSYEYRQYLINNADGLMKDNRLHAYNINMCGPCVEPFDIGTMLQEESIVMCDANTCKTMVNDPNGLGTGRQYATLANSKSRTEFLKAKHNEQTFMRQHTNCCTNSDDDLKYYPYDGSADVAPRTAVPGGGVPLTGGDLLYA
jgi:hypothetical protein